MMRTNGDPVRRQIYAALGVGVGWSRGEVKLTKTIWNDDITIIIYRQSPERIYVIFLQMRWVGK